MPLVDFGNRAILNIQDLWLCVPASRQVCPSRSLCVSALQAGKMSGIWANWHHKCRRRGNGTAASGGRGKRRAAIGPFQTWKAVVQSPTRVPAGCTGPMRRREHRFRRNASSLSPACRPTN